MKARVRGRWAQRWRTSPRVRVARLSFEASPATATALAAWTVSTAGLPLAMFVAMGTMIGRVALPDLRLPP